VASGDSKAPQSYRSTPHVRSEQLLNAWLERLGNEAAGDSRLRTLPMQLANPEATLSIE